MKIRGLKYNLLLTIIAMILAIVDVLLMIKFGFDGQLLIGLYVIIGVVPICAIVAICIGWGPTIQIDDVAKTITAFAIYDERRSQGKNSMFTLISIDEILQCDIENKTILLKMKWNTYKRLYLSAFTNKQILKIKNDINKRL